MSIKNKNNGMYFSKLSFILPLSPKVIHSKIFKNAMMVGFSWRYFCLLFATVIVLVGCTKEERNPNIPDVFINFTIDPNSTFYQPLNTAGGWMYLTSEPPSRGIIIHRINLTEFVAFDRIPPNDPNKCCDGNNCTRLIVDSHYPFAKDTCTETLYSLLDGSIFQGVGRYPMIRYNAVYNGGLLRVFN